MARGYVSFFHCVGHQFNSLWVLLSVLSLWSKQKQKLKIKKVSPGLVFFAGKQVVDRQSCPRAVDRSLGLM
jgi:hypothetical protein